MTTIDRGTGSRYCRIALTGASGSGKSTLARYLSEIKEFNLPYIENSAGNIMDPIARQKLMDTYGWRGEGHQEVITLSSTNPKFGKAFQLEVLKARANLIADNPRFIFDRSPLDNLTYFMLQYGHNASEIEFQEFIYCCSHAFRQLDALIFVRMVNPDEIEDNGSRIAKKHYQGLVDTTFHYMLTRYLAPTCNVKILTLDFWDLGLRKKVVKDFVGHLIAMDEPTK